MARIAFFTERLPPNADPIARFSYGLIYSLAEQEHDVQVYSTYRAGEDLPNTKSRFQILRPFRKWNWLELPALLPSLIDFKPQILHVIQPHARAMRGLTNAMSALPGLGPLIGRPRIVTTYYDLHSQQLSSQRLLLAGSHLVTVSNARQRELMDNYCRGFKKKRPEVEILPVPAFRDSEFANSRSSIDDAVGSIGDPAEHLRDFLDQSNQLIFIPGDLDRHPDLMGLLRVLADLLTEQESVSVLFGGGWGEIFPVERKRLMAILEERGLGARVFISGPISEDIELFCLERSLAVFLASLTRESLSLTRLLRTVLMSASAIPIMSKSQAAIDSLPWQSNISESNHHTSPGQAILTDDSPLAWKNALTLALTSPELVRKIREELPEFARLQTLDQPGNVMSRLYARLLDQPN